MIAASTEYPCEDASALRIRQQVQNSLESIAQINVAKSSRVDELETSQVPEKDLKMAVSRSPFFG